MTSYVSRLGSSPHAAEVTLSYDDGRVETITLDDGMAGMLVTWLSKFPQSKRPLTKAQVGECLVKLDSGSTWQQLADSMGITEKALREQVPYNKRRQRGRRTDPARDQMAAMLRRAGRTWREIADSLDVTPDTARRMALRGA